MKEALNIQTELGVNDPNKTLAELGYTVATAQVKFPDYWRKWKEWAKADAAFLANTWFTSCSEQLSWSWGAANLYAGGSPGGVAQNGTPIKVNQQLRWPYGGYEGAGVFLGARCSTVMKPDHDRWNGDAKKRNVLVSAPYGQSDVFGYHEAAYLNDIRFDGDVRTKYHDASFESSGVVFWDAGEGSRIERIKSDNFNNYGILVVRGTPVSIGNASCFTNKRGAIGWAGGAGGTMSIDEVLSCDDTPAIIDMYADYNRESGGNLWCAMTKSETATIAEGMLGPNHVWNNNTIKLRGQFNAHFGMITYASGFVRSSQLFYVDCRLKDGTPQGSRIEARGKGFNYAALLCDPYLGIYFDAPPDYSSWHMTYDCLTGTLMLNGAKQTGKPFKKNAGPMGFIRAGEAFDFANATPQQGIMGPQGGGTVPTCTWVLGTPSAWSACVGGSQTRTTSYIPSIAGCTPTTAKPADKVETQACAVPGTGAVIATLNNFSNYVSGYKQTVDWKAVRSIELTGLKATSLASKFLFCNASGARIVIAPDGAVWFGDTVLKPAGTVQVDTAVDLVLTIPATDFTRIGDSNFTGSTNGNAFVGTITKVTVKQ